MAQKKEQVPLKGREVTRLPLAELLLDPNNPRFGLQDRSASQEQILDHIVEKFGVDDVLSSLAVNGYFDAEPLVCRKLPKSKKNVVVEGNRRLAACLILTEDNRAANQAMRSAKYGALWKKHDQPVIDPVPAILFESEEQEKAILSYLGVRHIASAQPWDSYAKAAWVAQVVETSGLNISDVSQMIGDQHQTIKRLLEGYYLVRQLIEGGEFQPEDSIRRGRGSVTEYPFSWIYTILGYTTVRNFLSLGEAETKQEPLARNDLNKGGLLLKSMFGDKARGRNAAVSDSRQLSQLASALASREKISLLEQGKTIEEIEILTQPIEARLADGLSHIRETLRDLIARLSEQDLDPVTASELVPTSTGNRKMAIDLDKRIREVAFGGDDED